MKRFILAIFMTLFMATLAMATAYDVTKGGTTGIPANAPGPYVLEYYINADAANAGAGYGAGDTLKFMAVPAGAVVYGVQVEIDTAEGAACTFDLRDRVLLERGRQQRDCRQRDPDFRGLGAEVLRGHG